MAVKKQLIKMTEKIYSKMNSLLYKISNLKNASLAAVCISALALQSCHDSRANNESLHEAFSEPRPEEALTKLMASLAKDDAPGFAALCSYPIRRPYPLKDIADSVSMVDYYPVLVDDSLKGIMKRSNLDDWEYFGWRGWSIGQSHPIWFDDGVQFIDYVSPAENGLKSILAREEIMSLAPQFRDGWSPVATLVQTDGETVFRIDSNGDVFRLMKFDSPKMAHGEPTLLLTGSLHNEGTAESPVFEFFGSNGIKAEYLPDSEPPVCVYVTNPKESRKAYPVAPAYWRDIIK